MSKAAQTAYESIRDAILSGEFAPGEHLTETELATSIGVSRTPVRDALLRLISDGLIEMQRNHGARVRTFTDRDIAEIFELRASLESYSARWAATHISDAQVAKLEALARKMEKMGRPKSKVALRKFAQLNTDFHRLIVEASGSKLLDGLLSHLIDMPLMDLKEGSWQSRVDNEKTNKQHRDLIAALKSRNAEWASSAMYAHVISTRPPGMGDAGEPA